MSVFRAIYEWWVGVRRLDVYVWRYADKHNTQIRVRYAPFGLLVYATMEKHAEPWDNFWTDLQTIVDNSSEGGTARVPIIRMVFAEAKR